MSVLQGVERSCTHPKTDAHPQVGIVITATFVMAERVTL